MIRDESGRKVIHCDRCPVRLDLGPAAIVSMHLRMPSGWVQDAPDHHLCPACTRREMDSMIAARRARERGQDAPA
jgi:hypothetical protein